MGERFNRKNFVGQRYGKLVVICDTGERQTSSSGSSKIIWLLQCDCGNEIKRTTQSLCNWDKNFNRDKAHCGCLTKTGSISIAYEIYRAEYSDGDISFESFLKLSQEDCHHCGSKVQNSGSIKVRRPQIVIDGKRFNKENATPTAFQYHGLDRIDNDKGHTMDNIVTCCAPCNYLRGSRNYNDFIDHVIRISNNHNSRMLVKLVGEGYNLQK